MNIFIMKIKTKVLKIWKMNWKEVMEGKENGREEEWSNNWDP